jgi:hypothetical protein
MTYAANTKVSVDKSKAEIERTVTKYGATAFGSFTERDRAVIVFANQDRRVRFDLPLPTGDEPKDDKTRRVRWRALLLCIKAKLESVEAKIETFEEAFLSHVVLPDGTTVGTHVGPHIDEAYKTGQIPPLLPPLLSPPRKP